MFILYKITYYNVLYTTSSLPVNIESYNSILLMIYYVQHNKSNFEWSRYVDYVGT